MRRDEARSEETRRDASKSNKVRAIKLYFWLANCRRCCCCLAWLNSCSCCCCCCFDSCATFLAIAVASTSKSRFSTQAARSSSCYTFLIIICFWELSFCYTFLAALLLLLLLVLLLSSQVMTHQGALLNSFYFAKSRGRGRGSRSRDRGNSSNRGNWGSSRVSCHSKLAKGEEVSKYTSLDIFLAAEKTVVLIEY